MKEVLTVEFRRLSGISALKTVALLSVMGIALVAGCGQGKPPTSHYERVRFNVEPFVEAGCRELVNQQLDCSETDFEERFGCRAFEVSEDWANLTPLTPMMRCMYQQMGGPRDSGIAPFGIVAPTCRRYIALVHDRYTVIDTVAAFRGRFAPIESAQEALAYLKALQRVFEIDEAGIPEGYRSFVESYEPTSAVTTDNGFSVRLFRTRSIGCGPHPTFAVDYRVSHSGDIEVVEETKLFEDPEMDALCVD